MTDSNHKFRLINENKILSDDDLNVTELAKDMLIMDLDTNRLLHYKSAAN